MDILAIDLETYSDQDITEVGVHRYTDSPEFEILLFAYSVNDADTQIIDIKCGEQIPDSICRMIFDKEVIKTSFNAGFEIACLEKHFGKELPPEEWRCSAAQARILALPMSLKGVGEVLGFDKQKMEEGSNLIKYFCKPCKPTKANGGRTRNLPEHAPDKWELFKKYCIRDVDVEKQVRARLHKYPIPEKEQEIFCLDHRINRRGIMVDMQLVDNAVECDTLYREQIRDRAVEITGLDNPNSTQQLKGWLSEQGMPTEKLSKEVVREMAEEADGEVEEMLNLRLSLSKTSVKKYEAMQRAVCSDGRVHDLYMYYGANRTGRFSGRLVQMQNLPQNHIEDLSLARDTVKSGHYEEL